MMEGMWIAQFQGIQGSSGGVVVFVKGKVLGGDEGFTYIGDYTEKGNSVNARVAVHNYDPKVTSVLGIGGEDVQLQVTGMVEGNIMRGQAALMETPGAGLALKLTKCAELP
jgi:hypothetical protein